jgi:four helix bundle protein
MRNEDEAPTAACQSDGHESSPPFDLRERTKRFGLRIIRLVETLPKQRPSSWVIGKQLLRCGTSVGANYRAACRARSPAEFCAKLGIVEEEADECLYWMELLIDSGLVCPHMLNPLMTEAGEILAIVIQSIKTARRRR